MQLNLENLSKFHTNYILHEKIKLNQLKYICFCCTGLEPTLNKSIAQWTHQTRLEVAASVTVQVMSTLEPLLAKMSGAPSILVTGTATGTLHLVITIGVPVPICQRLLLFFCQILPPASKGIPLFPWILPFFEHLPFIGNLSCLVKTKGQKGAEIFWEKEVIQMLL